MCWWPGKNAARDARRAAEAAARQARADAERQAAAIKASNDKAMAAMQSMIEKKPDPLDYTPNPTKVKSNLDDAQSGVRRKKKATKAKGLAGLRIQLNPSATPTAGLGGSGKANV
jgi:FtsZ-interacting cell division protein ZipA